MLAFCVNPRWVGSTVDGVAPDSVVPDGAVSVMSCPLVVVYVISSETFLSRSPRLRLKLLVRSFTCCCTSPPIPIEL